MGKIYCTACGKELDDSMNFCSNCGTPLNDEDETIKSKKVENDNSLSENSNKIKETSEKVKSSKYSSSTKVFLGVAGICIIIFILGIIIAGSALINSFNDVPAENNSKTITPSFTDSIYGINFQIPEGYETFAGTDNQNKGTMVTYDRTYLNHGGGGEITISVSTTKGSFHWDLSQNRAYDDVEVTINGHSGVLKSSGTFSYLSGDKLVTIQGASQQQLESIIIS